MDDHSVVRDLLTLAAAGALAPSEQRRVEEHLQRCEVCRTEFGEWMELARELEHLPIPMAPPRLVVRTQRLLSHAAVLHGQRTSRLGLALLIFFSWLFAVTTVVFIQSLNIPLAQWLDVSSTTMWVLYFGATWFATALAAGLLAWYWRQESRTV
jgi:predicted anti-sigma-YlaC factor YlaD